MMEYNVIVSINFRSIYNYLPFLTPEFYLGLSGYYIIIEYLMNGNLGR